MVADGVPLLSFCLFRLEPCLYTTRRLIPWRRDYVDIIYLFGRLQILFEVGGEKMEIEERLERIESNLERIAIALEDIASEGIVVHKII